MTHAHHITHFQSILGDNAVLTRDDDLSAYEQGWRGERGVALCVLRPTTTAEVSAIMAYCAAHELHIVPQSGNTGMVAGSTPDDSGDQIVLSLARMRQIYDIDPINKSAHCDAGLTLSALQTAAGEHHLTLPIDLGADPCIGGMVATNTGGSRFVKYRGMRDHIMGLKVVLADENGTVLDLLHPLHKNNTGLDLQQLFIGTGGIFGIVTEATIRLSPRQEQSATALLIPASLDAVNTLLVTMERLCGTYLSAFEGMSGAALSAAFAHNPSLTSPFGNDPIPDYAILVELSRSWPTRADEQSLDDVLESALAQIWEREDAPLDNALIGAPDKLWQMRHSISEGVQKSGKLYAFDISMKRGDVMRFRQEMVAALAETYPAITVKDFGHIGDGATHFALVLPHNDPRAQDIDFETEIRAFVNDRVVHDFGGSYSAEHGLGRKTQAAYDTYTPEDVKRITREIRAAIAPTLVGTIAV